MSRITSHVLDTSTGRPATAVALRLERRDSAGVWQAVSEARTDGDGRASDLVPSGSAEPGVYRLHFDTAGYFSRRGGATFYPEVVVVFEVEASQGHYHVPLLIGPWGYTTYRGS